MQIQAKEARHVITLNYRDGRPISEQIKDMIRHRTKNPREGGK